MALIKCPECNKEVSDKAPACIHCGNPMKVESIQGKAIFKATVSHTASMTSWKIFDTNGNMLVKIKQGESWETKIDKDTTFILKWSGWMGEKEVAARANKVNRFSIGVRSGGMAWFVSEVDTITSE